MLFFFVCGLSVLSFVACRGRVCSSDDDVHGQAYPAPTMGDCVPHGNFLFLTFNLNFLYVYSLFIASAGGMCAARRTCK